jgi:hypothetical protein
LLSLLLLCLLRLLLRLLGFPQSMTLQCNLRCPSRAGYKITVKVTVDGDFRRLCGNGKLAFQGSSWRFWGLPGYGLTTFDLSRLH